MLITTGKTQQTESALGQQYEYLKGGKPEGLAARRGVRKSEVRAAAVEGPSVGSDVVPPSEDVKQKMEADVEGTQAGQRHTSGFESYLCLDLWHSMGCCSQLGSGNQVILDKLSAAADFR